MSRFSDQIAAGLAKIRQHAGMPITIDNNSGDPDAVLSVSKAVPRKIRPQATDNFDQRELANGKVWECGKSDLGSTHFPPVRGYVITDVTTGEVWEVLDRSDTGRCWEYVDSGATAVKIFTLRKGT